MRTRHNSIYRLLDRDYHERFDFYSPRQADFYECISSKLPAGWEIKRRGMWFHCSSPEGIPPEQGWKIHISATRADARQILDRVSSLLFAAGGNDFKFALDAPTLFLLNGKNCPRGGSGKFITIYPHSNCHFLKLIEQLDTATREFRGPYILSDHRYKDSHVVFYRYGGMRLREALDVTGERTPVLVRPDGTEVPDRRLAYPATPEWAEAVLPVPDSDAESEDSYVLCKGRFRIESVMTFSNAGGVYRGTDCQTGASVVIKEARPHIETSDGKDAVSLLKKEYRLLTLLEDTGIAPKPIHLFEEGTHWFLVEEYVDGLSLSKHSALHNILLRTRPAEEDFQVWHQMFRTVVLRLISIIGILHGRNIVFSDLSPNNLIITGNHELKLIDFEGAYQTGVDDPTNIYTPGFVSTRRLQGAGAGPEDDYYSVGSVLIAYLLPVNGLFHLKPNARAEVLALLQRDTRLSPGIARMILSMMEPQAEAFSAEKLKAEVLSAEPYTEDQPYPAPEDNQNYASVLDGIIQHIREVATYNRPDRLFPADPKLFTTNPLSVAYGAAGVAYGLKKITGSVPQQVIDWILAHSVTRESYAPGLYLGTSGIAWTLLEAGEQKHAENLFQLTFDHPLLEKSPDLFYGSAGWGMACLRFFLETGNELYLEKARGCGNRFLEKTGAGSVQRTWTQPDRPVGLAHGASGMALYLLYLYLATGDERFAVTGRRALESDLAAAIETRDGGHAWGPAADTPNILYSYWRYGSAGIGTALLRYHAVFGDENYRLALDKIFIDADRKYTTLPGRFVGLAGIGDFLMDAWAFTGEPKYLESAKNIAQAVMMFSVPRHGIAFPGDFLSRLCCDYGTGSAGIGLFLNRLVTRESADFLLDDLLDRHSRLPIVWNFSLKNTRYPSWRRNS